MTTPRSLFAMLMCFAAIARPAAAAPTVAQTYYFSTSGSDRNDGLTERTPKQSLSLISELLRNGADVRLKRGDIWLIPELHVDLRDVSGGSASPLHLSTFGNTSAPRPEIRVLAQGAAAIFLLRDTRHMRVEDLDLRAPGEADVAHIEGGSQDVVFDRVTFTHAVSPSASACTGPTTTYYFSATGNDLNSGASPDCPKQHLNRIWTDPLLAPGVTVLLKRGDKWYDDDFGEVDLRFYGLGSGGPMLLGAYGSGPRPVVADMYNYVDWTPRPNQGPTVYRHKQHMFGDANAQVWRLFLNGVPLTRVGGHGVPNPLAALVDSSWCMVQEPDTTTTGWFIYLRLSTFDTTSRVETIEHPNDASGGYFVDVGPKQVGPDLHGTDNLTISDIEFRGGDTRTAMVFSAPTTNLTLQNLTLTEFMGYGISIGVNPLTPAGGYHASPQVLSCTVDKGWSDAMNREGVYFVNIPEQGPDPDTQFGSHTWGLNPFDTFYKQPGGDGIALRSTEGLVVRGCTIRNMGHSGIGTYVDAIGSPDYGVKNSVIELNDIARGTSSYCRAFAVVGGETQSVDNTIRRNYFHDLSEGSHLGGLRQRVYSNVFDGMIHSATTDTTSVPDHILHIIPSGPPLWLDPFPRAGFKDCLIANNTFAGVDTAHYDFDFHVGYHPDASNYGTGNHIIDNLFLDFTGPHGTPAEQGFSMVMSGSIFKDLLLQTNNGYWPAPGTPNVLYVNDTGTSGQTFLLSASGMALYDTLWIANRQLDPLLVNPNSITLPPARVRLNGASPYATGGTSIVAASGAPLGALIPYTRSAEAVDYDGIALDPAVPSLGAFLAPHATGLLNLDYKGPRLGYIFPRPGLSVNMDNHSWVVGDTMKIVGSHVMAASQSPTGGTVEYPFTVEVPTITARKTNGTVIPDQGYSNTDVTVTATAYIINTTGPDGRDASRNGATIAFPANGVFTAEGLYVTSAHGGGSAPAGFTSVTTRFTIDKTAPIVTGVVNNGHYLHAVTFSFNEGTGALDGAPVTSPHTVPLPAPGTSDDHTLVVTDPAGNVTTIIFTISNNQVGG